MTIQLIYALIFVLFGPNHSSTTSLYGTVTDATDSSPLIFATVTLSQANKVKYLNNTDINGNYRFDNIPYGIYDMEVSFLGYQTYRKSGIHIKKGKHTKLNVNMKQDVITLDEVIVVGSETPGIKYSSTSSRKLKKDNYQNVTSQYFEAEQRIHEVTAEEYDKADESAFKSPVNEALSTFSLDVDKASYSNVRRMIDMGQQPPADAVRLEEMVNYFSYNYPEPQDEHPLYIQSNYTDCPWNEDHQILHIGVQSKNIELDRLPYSNLVFLVDVSGSMQYDNKLPLVISSFKLLLEKLRDKDRVAIVTYAGHAGIALESTPASEKSKILESLDRLRAGGSTAGAEGINTAYRIAEKNFIKNGNNRVILATDGDFNVGVSSPSELEKLIEKKRKSGVYLSVLGFGTGNYKDNKMQVLSDKGNGNHAYIDNIREARKVLISEFGGTLFTVAKDVKIQIEFNPAYVKAYRLLGYENRRLNKEDFNDDRKDAGDLGSGHTVTAIYEVIPVNSKSDYMTSVDPLVFQEKSQEKVGVQNGKLALIKCRYKAPDGKTSTKFALDVDQNVQALETLDRDIAFSLAIAEFSLRISDSSFINPASLDNCIDLAENNIVNDKEGYKSEFVRLAKSLNQLHGDQYTSLDE